MSSTREDFVKMIKAQLDEWNAMIDELEAKSKKEKAGAKLKYDQQIKDMKNRRDAFRKKLDDVQGATDDGWETLKEESGKLINQMKNTLTETKEAFVQGLNEKR